MDNARIHHAVDVADFLDEKDIQYMFLPPYTPGLNPIENFFGTVKQAYRRDGIARTRTEMKERIEAKMNQVGRDCDMKKFYAHMRGYIEKCLAREPFFRN